MKRFNISEIEEIKAELQSMTYREVAEKHNCSIQLLQYYVGKKPEPIKVKCIDPYCKNMITPNHKSKLCPACYNKYYLKTRYELAKGGIK